MCAACFWQNEYLILPDKDNKHYLDLCKGNVEKPVSVMANKSISENHQHFNFIWVL